MSAYQADSFEEIRRRLEEIKAERNLALTGSAVVEPIEAPSDIDWTKFSADYSG